MALLDPEKSTPTLARWLANAPTVPFAVFWMMPLLPPSSTIQLFPPDENAVRFHAAEVIFAFRSKRTVSGFPLAPPVGTAIAVVIVPHRMTVEPAP